jgi:hypothetical protein
MLEAKANSSPFAAIRYDILERKSHLEERSDIDTRIRAATRDLLEESCVQTLNRLANPSEGQKRCL